MCLPIPPTEPVCNYCVIFEIKNLNKVPEISNSIIDDTSTDNKLNKKVIITISREYGSGGRYIGWKVAKKLNIPFYDKEILNKTYERNACNYTELNKYDETKKNKILKTLEIININNYKIDNNNFYDTYQNLITKTITDLSNSTSCVILGRNSNNILKNKNNVITGNIDEPLLNLNYEVHYYLDGVEDTDLAETELTAPYGTEISNYEDKCPRTYLFDKAKALDESGNEKDLPLVIKLEEDKNIIISSL